VALLFFRGEPLFLNLVEQLKKKFDQPVIFHNQTYALAKATDGSAHTTSFTELYEKVKPFRKQIGLQRLSNITGLDRIGVPVVNAVRPNITGLTISHGKGLTLDGAKASALMEALERFHGFNAEIDYFELPYAILSQNYKTIPCSNLDLNLESAFNPQLPEKWVSGWDLIHQEEVALPLASVLMGRSAHDIDPFFQSSNGLAAGLEFLEALSQSLFEVVERDAITCHHLYMQAQNIFFPRYRVKLETITVPTVQGLLTRIENAEIMPILFDCTVDTEIPTYECYLIDLKDPEMIIGRGMGTSFNIEIAMIRSITEAIQARAVFYSGCRETFFAAEEQPPGTKDICRTMKFLENGCERDWFWVDAEIRTSIQTGSFEEDVNRTLFNLQKIGIKQVIVANLAAEKTPFTALRVIIPGLEGIDELIYYAPGRRARKYMEGRGL